VRFISVIKFNILLIIISSCHGICYIEPKHTQEAERLYNSIETYRIYPTYQEAYDIFGDCYRSTDKVFVYQSIFKKKYILVRFGEPITYQDQDKWFGF
jgi:hypothetical protein